METEIIREIRRVSLDNNHRFSFVAKYIINNISIMPTLSIKELAKATYSSSSTINRFTKYLNLSGYKELIHVLKYFGYILIEDQHNSESSVNHDIFHNYYHDVINSIQDTYNFLLTQDNLMQEVVKKLKSAKKIYIFAVGTNFKLAKDFQYKLLRLGLNVVSADDIHNGFHLAKQSDEDTFNIFISYSGETQALIKLASMCKENNSSVLLISKKTNSTISKIADIKLGIGSNESIVRVVSVISRFALMFCLDMIFYNFLMLDFPHYKAILEATSSNVF